MLHIRLAVLVGVLAGAPAEGACVKGATVTFLANEAFVLSGRAGTVLIDALVRDGIESYPTPADATRVALESASGPFEHVDWALVSHHHDDHFAPESVVAHMRANPRARVASTPAVVGTLRAMLPGEFADRLLVVEPPARGALLVDDRSGLRIEAYALSHGKGRDVDNLGFVVELDGTTVLHMGDSEALGDELVDVGIAKREIDVALVPYWYVYGDRWHAALDRFSALGAVGLMHLPKSVDESKLRTLRRRRPTFRPLTASGAYFCAGRFTSKP